MNPPLTLLALTGVAHSPEKLPPEKTEPVEQARKFPVETSGPAKDK